MDRVRTGCTGSGFYRNERLVAQRLIAKFILRHLRYHNGLVLIADGIFNQRELSVQFVGVRRREGIHIGYVRAREGVELLMVNEDHLERIHIRFLDCVGNRVGTCTAALGSNGDLPHEGIGGTLHRIHLDCLPLVAFLPREIGERSRTYRQRELVILLQRFEVRHALSVLIDHLERIRIGLRELEDYDVRSGVRGLFGAYVDGSLVLLRIHDNLIELLSGIALLSGYLRQAVNTHRESNLIYVILRCKSLQ